MRKRTSGNPPTHLFLRVGVTIQGSFGVLGPWTGLGSLHEVVCRCRAYIHITHLPSYILVQMLLSMHTYRYCIDTYVYTPAQGIPRQTY
ncbi:hypothetical protein F5B17DRAFT_409229 [Nemania serpens]|nr:hypothetical protein F5B17DRAFT_409229 [Nemania serpens]